MTLLTNRNYSGLKHKKLGFTVAEVVIALAIGSLILVVVLMGFSALQRSQHDKARQEAATRLVDAMVAFKANNNGIDVGQSDFTASAKSSFEDALTSAKIPTYNNVKVCFFDNTSSSAFGITYNTGGTITYPGASAICNGTTGTAGFSAPNFEIWRITSGFACSGTGISATPGGYSVAYYSESRGGSVCVGEQ